MKLSILERWFSKPPEAAAAARPQVGSPRPDGSVELETVRYWLATKLADVLGVTPEEVDPDCTFTEYGLDSMQAVRLSGDLETWMGRELSPLLLYDYPSIETLARYLAGPIEAPTAVAEPATLSIPVGP